MVKRASLRHFLFLIRYALRYRKLVLAQFAFMGLSISFGLLKPWPLKVLVDNVALNKPFAIGPLHGDYSPSTLLLGACLAFLIFSVGEALIQLGASSVASLSSANMIRDLRADLLRHLEALSLKFHDNQKVGDLVHRVSHNATAVEVAFQSGFMGAIKSSLSLIGMFIVMMTINATLTLVAIAIVPLLLITIRVYASRIHAVSRAHEDQEGMVFSRAQEILSSIRLVQAFTQEEREHDRFNKVCGRSVLTRLKMTVVQNSFGFFVAAIMALGTVLLFWIGMQKVLSGALSIGDFLVFNAYLAMLYAPLSVLSYTSSSVQSALGGGSRLFEIFDAEIDIKNRPGARAVSNLPASIECDNVSFSYEPGKTVLNRVSLTAPPGQMIAIVGETGGGKSTLLNVILRFYEPQEGKILYGGEDITGLTIKSLRENVALVPQDTLLFSDSIRENIAYARPSATDEQIRNATRLAEAHEFIAELPNGYDTLVGERGIKLSTGQRQRLALARAFLKDAPLLVMDEPTSALDAETESKLMSNLLARMQTGKTMIIVAHRLSTIRMADKIIVLSHGRVEESGTHEELLVREGAYYRLWQAQHGEQIREARSAV